MATVASGEVRLAGVRERKPIGNSCLISDEYMSNADHDRSEIYITVPCPRSLCPLRLGLSPHY